MATEFPVDPEFNRFIAGLKDVPEGGVEIELPPEDAEVEELEDGSRPRGDGRVRGAGRERRLLRQSR